MDILQGQARGITVIPNVFVPGTSALSQSSRLWGPWVTNLVDKLCDKTLSLTVTPLTRFPKGMLPTGLSGSWPELILVADGLANFGG